MRILFVGDINFYSNSMSRLHALRDFGVAVASISHTQVGDKRQGCPEYSFAYRLAHRFGVHLDTENANRQIIEAVRREPFDCVWIEKGTMIRAATLARVKQLRSGALLYAYSDDDMFLPHNRTRAFLRGLPLYDRVFTTKTRNARPDELPALGARDVVVVEKAFDPSQHYPIEVTEDVRMSLGADIGFIGTYERERADTLFSLARFGLNVRVWGNGWKKCPHRHPNLRIERQAVVNSEDDLRYTKAICATRINLAFLRKLNRDQHTDRSVEIPACGGFMLAERTEEHCRLFDEDREASFFSSEAELLEKIRYYLEHEDERVAIAHAGRRRCVESDYSHHARIRLMLSDFLN